MPELLAQDIDDIHERTQSLWEDLGGGRLFMTGGTGFTGRWLLESFARANARLKLDAQVVVLTRHPQAFCQKAPHLACHPAIQFHMGDVRSFTFPGGRFTHVIHAAAERDPGQYAEHPMRMLDIMLSGTRRVLDFALQCGNPKFLLVSSEAVYGSGPARPAPIVEDYPGEPDVRDPRSVFGEGKRLSEMLCLTYGQHYGIQIKIGRCFSSVGPHLPLAAHCMVGRFLMEGLQGGPIRVNGQRADTSSYLYAADQAVWLWTILVRGECGRAYNVGSERAVTAAELASLVGQAFSPPVEVSFLAQDPNPGQAQSWLPSTQAAQAKLQLFQAIDLEEAIRRTVVWMRRASQ
jgi:dTDP-glucose 4,6-dehydratase